MDPIEKFIVEGIGINIPGHRDLYDLSESFGRAPGAWSVLDPSLKGDPISRLKWSRYNVLFCFARARYLCIDEFNPLMMNPSKPDGQLHFRRLAVLFDCFRVLGTLLDSLAEEANVIYGFNLPKEKVTITYLRSTMDALSGSGKFASPQQKEFTAKILSLLTDPQMERTIQFRHVSTHRPKLRWMSGDGRSMFLPIDPTLDPDDDSLWNGNSFQPKACPAHADLNGMLSRVAGLIDAWYVLTNRHFEELFVT